jgi:hypothetical protein
MGFSRDQKQRINELIVLDIGGEERFQGEKSKPLVDGNFARTRLSTGSVTL